MSIMFTCEDIRQYYYCPRKIYFRYVLRVRTQETYKMKKGRLIHEKANLGENTVKDVYLCSEELGIVGIIDILEFVDNATVNIIEIKTSKFKGKMYEDHKVQLAAQAMLVENVLGLKVNKIRTLNIETGKYQEVHITEYHREMVRHALEKMKHIVLNEIIPEPTKHRARCIDCECRSFCVDVF